MKQLQQSKIQNKVGVVLSVKKVGNKGRLLHVFTKDSGNIVVFTSESTIKKYGSGYLTPYALLRITVTIKDELFIMTQYEGQLLFNMLQCSYKEVNNWSFVSALMKILFAPLDSDLLAWQIILQGAFSARIHNKSVCALITSLQLLTVSGFNPLEQEPLSNYSISKEAYVLLQSLQKHQWGEHFYGVIGKSAYKEVVIYINDFIESYCDLHMKVTFEV